jgi:CheY-like chemotaxis protein
MPTRILIVEDEYLVAMDLQKTIEAAGYEALGPMPSVSRALVFLEGEAPDACILDIDLRGEFSTPVAAQLKRRGIPFVVSSAQLSDQLSQLDAFDGIKNIGKPPSDHDLLKALGDLLGR